MSDRKETKCTAEERVKPTQNVIELGELAKPIASYMKQNQMIA